MTVPVRSAAEHANTNPAGERQLALLREALDKLERTERLLDGRHFRSYPVRKRREALRDLAASVLCDHQDPA